MHLLLHGGYGVLSWVLRSILMITALLSILYYATSKRKKMHKKKENIKAILMTYSSIGQLDRKEQRPFCGGCSVARCIYIYL